jgi:hypothetical protein
MKRALLAALATAAVIGISRLVDEETTRKVLELLVTGTRP